MIGKIILVTGGARSGKSSYAEKLAFETKKAAAYIATAQIFDAEMQLRVKMHKDRRQASWTTYEAQFSAAAVITEAAEGHEVILFDCVTLYLSNLLLNMGEASSILERKEWIMAEFDRLLAAAKTAPVTTIFVTNELGSGIVPENALAREYRDLAGWVNQKFAATADEVYLVVCGIPLKINKGEG